jgi:serine phosphatase RsbU (regulator of sigma subunit)
MGSAMTSPILLCAEEPASAADVRGLLEEAGHRVEWHPLGGDLPGELTAYGLAVLEGSRQPSGAWQFCRRLRLHLADEFVPILFVTDDHAPATRLASLESGADTCLLRPFAPGELLAQVQAFLRIKELHNRLTEKTAEVHHMNRRLQQAYQRVDEELELARRIQQSFLPQSLPEVPRLRFGVRYMPCGRVGGDFYDVFRLDEHHVGFYVADAMGHGVPASLLTIFLKKGVRTKEILGKQYRLLPPDEVLARLNRDLIDQGLSESPFITMVYGYFDGRDGMLHFARAGHPNPARLTAGRPPELLKVEGPLLGVFEAEYSVQRQQLQPGDKVLLYTDGCDGVTFEGGRPGTDSLLACADRHRALPVQDFIDRVADDLARGTGHEDDFTLLGLEVKP